MADVIDISMKQLNDRLKNTSGIKSFLKSDITIEEKTDGVKVQLILKDDADIKKPYYENWIISYKGNVIYPGEFDYQDDETIKKESIGSSQFKFIFNYLKDNNISIGVLPKGYQFFCEYLIKKPTLMSQYTDLYKLILLAYGPSSYEVKNGILITNNKTFNYDGDRRIKYASAMGWEVPPIIYEGKLQNIDDVIQGVNSEDISNILKANKYNLSDLKPEEYLYKIEELLLKAESQFGGSPEGYVIHYNGEMFKFQQTYQLSKEERIAMKMKFKAGVMEESVYWADVKTCAKELFDKTVSTDFESSLKKLSELLKTLTIIFTHPKKNDAQIKDDIQLTTKLMYVREFADKWVIVQGKFRIFTNAHYDIIKRALKENDGVVLNVVSNKDTSKYLHLRQVVIEDCFKDEIKSGVLEVVYSRTGNINNVLRKTYNQIFKIYTGSDRVDDYQSYIDKYNMDVKIIEVDRDENDISASKIEANIGDEDFFKANTPKAEHTYYKEFLKVFK